MLDKLTKKFIKNKDNKWVKAAIEVIVKDINANNDDYYLLVLDRRKRFNTIANNN